MQIHTGTVVTGTEVAVGIGLTNAMRCVLRTETGEVVGAILKRIPFEAVVTESVAALLLRAWNIPVPDPYIVADGDLISFASRDTGYPNLMKFIGVDALPQGSNEYEAALRIAAQLAAGLPSTAAVLAADEAIANSDRNLGNILWDGVQESWIDHERSLARDGSDASTNKLADIAIFAGAGEDVERTAVSAWLMMDRTVLSSVAEAVSPVASCETIVEHVAERLNRLGMLITSRFPRTDDLFAIK